MIAVGDVYREISNITAPRAERVLDCPVRLFTETELDPKLLKLELFQHVDTEHVLMLDCDIVLHAWDWSPFRSDAFNAVHCQNIQNYPPIWNALRAVIPEPVPLFNTGLWLAPRGIEPVFSLAKHYLFDQLLNFPLNFAEETPTNLALHRTEFAVNILPERYNRCQHLDLSPYTPDAKDVFGMHLLSGTPEQKLERIRTYCERFPLDSQKLGAGTLQTPDVCAL